MNDDRQPKMTHGRQQLETEMARQHADALASWRANRLQGGRAAAAMMQSGRVVLLGMGGSHWINRVALPAYRAAGIDASAEILSEFMRAPAPVHCPLILTSQSGASGEIVRFLDDGADCPVFGLTLDEQSPLGRRTVALVGYGGVERAYAATRSLLITLALHAAILDALGADMTAFLAELQAPFERRTCNVSDHLATAGHAVFVGRGPLQGIADAAALSFMELARIPVLSLEAGQFRHGPFELIGPDTGLVFVRGPGNSGDNIDGLARESLATGARPIIFDVSGDAEIGGCLTVLLGEAHGMAAAARVLPVLQRAVVDAADAIVDNVGIPLRSRKVTSGEAA